MAEVSCLLMCPTFLFRKGVYIFPHCLTLSCRRFNAEIVKRNQTLISTLSASSVVAVVRTTQFAVGMSRSLRTLGKRAGKVMRQRLQLGGIFSSRC